MVAKKRDWEPGETIFGGGPGLIAIGSRGLQKKPSDSASAPSLTPEQEKAIQHFEERLGVSVDRNDPTIVQRAEMELSVMRLFKGR